MDGFAVRAIDTMASPSRLRIVGSAPAGAPTDLRVEAGQAIAISTGAVLPRGADAIVPLEETRIAEGQLLLHRPAEAGQHVRRSGEDLRKGDLLLPAGRELGPGQLAAMAAVGAGAALVRPRPRVVIVPTGDEVRLPAEALGAGQVFDAVTLPLLALIEELGATGRGHPVAPDDPASIRRAVRAAAARADAVLTVGGVSVGRRDLIATLGGPGEIRVYRLALRPAKPFAFGAVFGVPLFGLPGNPASALVAFEELVRPALLVMMGKAPAVRASLRATLGEPIPRVPGQVHMVRVELWHEAGRVWARPAGMQGAGIIHSLARADGWAVVPSGRSPLPAGARVDVRPLRSFP
jgi:molybdopterin molybdotransferase